MTDLTAAPSPAVAMAMVDMRYETKRDLIWYASNGKTATKREAAERLWARMDAAMLLPVLNMTGAVRNSGAALQRSR